MPKKKKVKAMKVKVTEVRTAIARYLGWIAIL